MPKQELRFEDCYFIRDGDTVTLGNSRIERVWATHQGLWTTHLIDRRIGRDWSRHSGGSESNITTEGWSHNLLVSKVQSVDVKVIETPISKACIRVQFTIDDFEFRIRKCFDIFPEVPAIRAWLELTPYADTSGLDYTAVEELFLDFDDSTATAIELHDLTDYTNHLATVRKLDNITDYPIYNPLSPEYGPKEAHRLVGNNIFIEKGNGEGVFGYKESPVPNSQLYHLYYDFKVRKDYVQGVGAGFHNVPAGETRRTHAFTFGVYSGGLDGGILALKEYQKARYKTVPERDYIISANSWGDFSTDINEEKLIAEVEAAAELGIESVAVDAGWTKHVMGGDPDPEKFPNGFGPLCKRAKELGVKLELWMVPTRLDGALDLLKEHPDWVARTNNRTPCDTQPSYGGVMLTGIELCNPDCFKWMKDYFLRFYDEGFERFKMDTFQCDGFDTLEGDLYDHYEALRRLMHELVVERPGLTFTQDSTRTNRPIYDYYMDYGIIFLENRYQNRPIDRNGRYLPWKTLRNLWQVSPYIPPQKLNMELSNDEEGYTPEYLLATVMFANPLFWESLAAISEESRERLKPLIAMYKQHRAAIYAGHIFPLGEMPDGTTWTGFQSHDPKTGSGYLIAYREDSPEESDRFRPKFLARTTRFESLTDDSPALTCERPEDGIEVSLPSIRSFRLYRYS